MKNRLCLFPEFGLEVTASTLLLGLDKFAGYDRLITGTQMNEWLLENMEKGTSRCISEEISIRLLAYDDDLSMATKILERCAVAEPSGDADERLKWTAILLYEELSVLAQNAAPTSIFDLNSFWATLEWPPYSHKLLCDAERYTIGRNGLKYSRSEHFSQSSCNAIITCHWDWLEQTVKDLGGLLPAGLRTQMEEEGHQGKR